MEFRLLDEFQRDFPLCSHPFSKIASTLGTDELGLLRHLGQLTAQGKISRIGPVFAPKRVGASTLAAMSVATEQLGQIAQIINRFPEVNHNYEREHRYNLWFVVTAVSDDHLQETLKAICHATGHDALSLPMEESFHIDLGFGLSGNSDRVRYHCLIGSNVSFSTEPLSPQDRRLLAALQHGLPLQTDPFQHVAQQTDDTESNVLQRVQAWVQSGVIKRFGIIVRHHELGYTANAMVVHDIPDEEVQQFGQALSQDTAVTLCYRRRRSLPEWPYNLFCMIHGQERAVVEQQIDALRDRCGLMNYPHAVLFSRDRFKQQGARYA